MEPSASATISSRLLVFRHTLCGRARDELGAEAADVEAEGRRLPFDEAVEYARDLAAD